MKYKTEQEYNKLRKSRKAWRTATIVLTIVLALWLTLGIVAINGENRVIRETNICYYDVCGAYPYAEYDSVNKVCDCYDYDVLGDLVYKKSEYMGKR